MGRLKVERTNVVTNTSVRMLGILWNGRSGGNTLTTWHSLVFVFVSFFDLEINVSVTIEQPLDIERRGNKVKCLIIIFFNYVNLIAWSNQDKIDVRAQYNSPQKICFPIIFSAIVLKWLDVLFTATGIYIFKFILSHTWRK